MSVFGNLLIGMFITTVSQVDEVADFSNAVSFQPANMAQMEEYLIAIDNRMDAVISIGAYFYDVVSERYAVKSKELLQETIDASGHTRKVILLFDEPLWKMRQLVGSDYLHDETLETLEAIVEEFRGFEFMHIEAYSDLYQQYNDSGNVRMLYSSAYLGFDCYGPFMSCGDNLVGRAAQPHVLELLHKNIIANASAAKIMLIPGTFLDEKQIHYKDSGELVSQFLRYMDIVNKNSSIIGGIGGFAWGNMSNNENAFTGARDIPWLQGLIRHQFSKLLRME